MSQLIPFTESGEGDEERPGSTLSTASRGRGALARAVGGVMRSRALHIALAVTPAVIAAVRTVIARGRRG